MFTRIRRFIKEKILNFESLKLDVFFRKRFLLYSVLFFLACLLTFSINTIFIEKVMGDLDIDKLMEKPFRAQKNNSYKRAFNVNSMRRNIFNKDGVLSDIRESASLCQVQEISESPYYKIEGMFYGGNAKSSTVLVFIKSKSIQEAFNLNDTLPQGEVIIDIKENGILLKKLSCPYFLVFGDVQAKPKSKYSDPSQTIFKEPGFERTHNKIKATHSWLKQVLSDNFSETLLQARAIPFKPGGRMRGFRLVQIEPGSVYEKIGLKNGDVIMSIDGESLNDAGKAYSILNTLRSRFEGKSKLSIKLRIFRAGKVLTYDIQVD